MRRAAVLLAVALLAAAPAHAAGFDADAFQPAVSRSGYFSQESPRVLGHLLPNAGLVLSYGTELLVARDPVTGDMLANGALVDGRLTGYLTAALGLWNRAELGLRLPLVLRQTGELSVLGAGGQVASTALGDVAAVAKVRLLGPVGWGSGFRLAGTLAVFAPTGSEHDFTGGSLAVRPGLVAGIDTGPLSAALNLAYRVRGNAELLDLVVDDELEAGLGAALALIPEAFWLQAEVFGRRGVNGGEAESPLEADAGLRFVLARSWMVQAGVGAGLSQGYGTPKLRGLLSVGYAPAPRAAVSSSPGQTLVPASGDRDGDGVADSADRCPDAAEDKDGFEDDDGCPDLDNDQDGVLDGSDACPSEAEDRDGYQDADGCPDLDNDQDGVADARDQCPDRPEDKDGFADEDGCPDMDNDGDGLADLRDKCPNEAEVFNGNADDDGCPDQGAPLVELTREKLVIKQEVKFQSSRAKVKPDSFQLLATVAKLLVLHPEIKSVRVEGHTDARGKRAKNLKLSQARAEAVRRHLIEVNGIDGERLQAAGYGPDKPVAPNTTKQGRGLNRRVEFVILAQ